MDEEMCEVENTENSEQRIDSEVSESIFNENIADNTEAQNAYDTNDVEDTANIESELIDGEVEDTTNVESELIDEVEDTTNVESELIDEVEDTTNVESELIAGDANDAPLNNKSSEANAQAQRLTRLPLARIKNIMKFDDDVHAASQESAFLITKATELFIEDFVKEVYQCTLASKKKTISKRDIDTAIFSHDYFIFLDGALD